DDSCDSFAKSLIIYIKYIAIIHSYRACVINADNKMITLACIGRIIWINQIIKRTTNTTMNNL
ncbi:MAG: hypothetical protein MR358_01560, partial [Clostridiales bacterium]|nr:hypothetical protein [Clostridiales bacterium]